MDLHPEPRRGGGITPGDGVVSDDRPRRMIQRTENRIADMGREVELRTNPPDFSPVMGLTPIGNYFIDAGWGTWGFKATPVCGKRMAETVASGTPPPLISPFALDRFTRFAQIGERGAASVGH
jgi:glycine/D-amino acid oxidase-like deaminating enzyme